LNGKTLRAVVTLDDRLVGDLTMRSVATLRKERARDRGRRNARYERTPAIVLKA
jgi:hypothetical protein